MRQFAIFLAQAALALCNVIPALAEKPADPRFENLPLGCVVTRSDTYTGAQRDAVAGKLGRPLKSLSNTYLKFQGKAIRVNLLEAKSIEDAEFLEEKIRGMKNDPAFCLRNGTEVIEFLCNDPGLAVKTTYELGFAKRPSFLRYEVTAHLAPVDSLNYMATNELFAVILQTDSRSPDPEKVARIEKLSGEFTFGNTIALRAPLDEESLQYSWQPSPIETETTQDGRVVFSFGDLQKQLGVPYATLRARIDCNENGLTPTDRLPDPSLTAATSFWPVDSPEIQKLAGEITKGASSQEAKVEALLKWLAPNHNIHSKGPTGSRWGVEKVLKQRFGHCWDSSDLFVTLARATGIPCRQVAGWYLGLSGHVWAEVLIEGRGWQQVDPTGAGKLKCGIYHIPWFTTEDGDMPLLYLSMPKIVILKTENQP